MKILVIPAYYGFGRKKPGASSGTGIFFKDQAAALAEFGHDVSLLHLHFDAEEGIEIEEVHDAGVRCIYIHARPLKVPVNLLYRIALTTWTYGRKLAANRPDIIHAHSYRAGLFARTISMLWNVPYVITEHSSTIKGSLPSYWRLVARWSFSGANRVMAVSGGLAAAMRRYTHREIRVIPNLVRDEFFDTPLRTHFREPAEPFRFLSVGYASPNKGWDILIPAFADLRSRGHNATLRLCGGGEGTDVLRGLAEQLNLTDHIHFTGKVSHQAVKDFMDSCDCHVQASRLETFGIVNIEALALGKPIIMTATDAAGEIVNDRNGLVVPTLNASKLAEAMETLINEWSRYDPQIIREECRSLFSQTRICQLLTDTYWEAISEMTRTPFSEWGNTFAAESRERGTP